MSFIGAAPAVVVDHWHLRETQFAYLFIPVIGGIVAGAWASGRMAGRLTHARQTRLGFHLTLGAAALMIVALLVLPGVLSVQQVLLGAIAFGVQLVAPPLTLRMLDLYPLARGSAASVQSCVSIAISALVFGLLSPLLSTSLLTLALGSLCATLTGLGLWLLAQRTLPRALPA
ncbi:MAG: hypothetical protein JOY91_01745, partial [Sinobacteraceae bacterium]|nr:hypothetical protein [Nevskiaceae bacterium]